MPACNLPPNVLDCILYLRETSRSLFKIASLISCIDLVLDWDIQLAHFASVLYRLQGDRQHAWAAWPNWLGLVGTIRPPGPGVLHRDCRLQGDRQHAWAACPNWLGLIGTMGPGPGVLHRDCRLQGDRQHAWAACPNWTGVQVPEHSQMHQLCM